MPAANTRQGVRTAIAQYFGGTTYDQEARAYRSGPLASSGLSTVRAYPSKRVNDNDYVYAQAAGRGMGAYMITYLPKDRETRISLGGPTAGIKRVRYQVALAVFHLAHKAHAEDAEADVDALVEAIKDLIHSDRTLGTTGSSGPVITQAGETAYGIQTTVHPAFAGRLESGSEYVGTYAQIIFDADTQIIA